MGDKNYEFIEHTADIGIRVKGKDSEDLFKNAALAMFDIIAEKKDKARSESRQRKIEVRQEAGSLEELLVNWLNELLSLSAAEELIFFNFQSLQLKNNKLKVEVIGRGFVDYIIKTEIKAATYCGLKLEQVYSGWQAEIIFDV
ncbi:MAG: archease [Candidatus Omnitrophota bacterium]